MEDIAKRVLRYRAKKGLTQLEFANICRVSPVTMCAVEKGVIPSKITTAKIELILGGESFESKSQ